MCFLHTLSDVPDPHHAERPGPGQEILQGAHGHAGGWPSTHTPSHCPRLTLLSWKTHWFPSSPSSSAWPRSTDASRATGPPWWRNCPFAHNAWRSSIVPSLKTSVTPHQTRPLIMHSSYWLRQDDRQLLSLSLSLSLSASLLSVGCSRFR